MSSTMSPTRPLRSLTPNKRYVQVPAACSASNMNGTNSSRFISVAWIELGAVVAAIQEERRVVAVDLDAERRPVVGREAAESGQVGHQVEAERVGEPTDDHGRPALHERLQVGRRRCRREGCSTGVGVRRAVLIRDIASWAAHSGTSNMISPPSATAIRIERGEVGSFNGIGTGPTGRRRRPSRYNRGRNVTVAVFEIPWRSRLLGRSSAQNVAARLAAPVTHTSVDTTYTPPQRQPRARGLEGERRVRGRALPHSPTPMTVAVSADTS